MLHSSDFEARPGSLHMNLGNTLSDIPAEPLEAYEDLLERMQVQMVTALLLTVFLGE